MLFSERYGYTKPSDVMIREQITLEIQNAICSCFDRLESIYSANDFSYPINNNKIQKLECFLWTDFLNKRENDFPYTEFGPCRISTIYISNKNNAWYQKLNILECAIKYLYEQGRSSMRKDWQVYCAFVKQLNHEFERLNFAYRIVENEIIEITSKEEIESIESAMSNSKQNIRAHLSKALELYSQRPVGDYCNSIKESISAVEALCRELTNTNTLGKALNVLKTKGVSIPEVLLTAFDKLYAYTNSQETGIRHALMDADAIYAPSAEEALFMLVTCSAFINYLTAKTKGTV